MDINEKTLKLHYEMKGKLEVISPRHITTREEPSLFTTPGIT